MDDGGGRDRPLLAAWWMGVRAPVLWTVPAALALTAVLGLALAGSISAPPEDLAELPLGEALRHPKDGYRYVAHRTLTLERTPPEQPTFYLLGGSSIRECVPSSDSLTRSLSRHVGAPWRAEVLAHTNQTYGQALAIIEHLPPGSGLVALSVGHWRFARDPDLDRKQARASAPLELPSHELAAAVGVEPPAPQAARRRSLLASRSEVGNAIRGWLSGSNRGGGVYQPHLYTESRVLGGPAKDAKIQHWLESRGPTIEERIGHNLAMIERCIALGRERELLVVLIEQPLNRERIGDRMAPFERRAEQAVDALIDRTGIDLIRVRPDPAPSDAMFYDLTHLVEPGREIWQEAMAAAVAERIRSAER